MLDDHTNQVNSYKRPEHDLLIVAQGERFFISQNGRKYASRRALTTTLCKIFDHAIDAGLSCLLRNAHPSLPFLEGEPNFEKGSPHIGFSRCANERWVFVIDQYSGKTNTKNLYTIDGAPRVKTSEPVFRSGTLCQ